MRNLRFFTLAVALMPMSVQAVTCEQFKAAIIEGAAMHQSPAPIFHMSRVNSADPNSKYWNVQMFDDVRAMVSCWRGSVGTFAADAKNSQPTSGIHLTLLMGMALRGYGLEWREALSMRDKLVGTAEASNPHMAKIPFGARKASLIVSIAGVPNFRIDLE
jgi:hypothetical protein